MRKLIVSMNLSLDGCMSGPQCELDWHFETWNEEMADKLLEHLDNADTILLGRITYEAMAAYWSARPLEQNFPRQDLAIADKMNRHTKVVFSRTSRTPHWNNTKFAGHHIEDQITKLKQEKGKDILLFGSGRLVTEIIQFRLADEYRLWVHPIILGKGKSLFKNLNERINMKLIDSFRFRSGVIVFRFAPVYK